MFLSASSTLSISSLIALWQILHMLKNKLHFTLPIEQVPSQVLAVNSLRLKNCLTTYGGTSAEVRNKVLLSILPIGRT